MKKLMAVIASSLLLVGCDAMHESVDYERHSNSQLSTPRDGTGGFYWYDVKLTPQYPDNNEAAEAVRMQWLETWLSTRDICEDGYDILERREFDFLEHNPARYDLRYKVQCKVPSLDDA